MVYFSCLLFIGSQQILENEEKTSQGQQAKPTLAKLVQIQNKEQNQVIYM